MSHVILCLRENCPLPCNRNEQKGESQEYQEFELKGGYCVVDGEEYSDIQCDGFMGELK